MPLPRLTTSLGSLSLLLTVAACASPFAANSDSDTPPEPPTTDAPASRFTADNCGVQISVEAPPQRVVTIKSTTLELMLALDLGDRIVGTAFSDGPVPERWAAVAADLPELSDRVPAIESLLESEPDLVYAGWESNLESGGESVREQLAHLGVTSFVSPAACQAPEYMPNPMSFDLLFAEFEQVGELFGVPERAEELVNDQRAALADLEPHPGGLTALWFSSGSDTPFVGAGIGAPQMIMDAAGLVNIAADVHDTWTSLNWEAVIDADPDVLVLVDSEWNSAENKKEFLTSNPATEQLTAVQQERYIVVPFPAGEAGVRNVDAVGSVLEQLQELDG